MVEWEGEAIGSPPEFERLDRADLSPWFNPFLAAFAREAHRCGGDARVQTEGPSIRGLLVTDPVEGVASVFTRSREAAERWVRQRGSYGVFSGFFLEPTDELFDIFLFVFGREAPPRRFRNVVRSVTPDDLPRVLELMREVYGPVNERWLSGMPSASEVGFLCEVEGRPVGVAWVSLAGRRARLHSLTVRAPFRRMGIGSDLLSARLLWAQGRGATEAISEISRLNRPSQALAARSGMRSVGEIFFHRRVESIVPR